MAAISAIAAGVQLTELLARAHEERATASREQRQKRLEDLRQAKAKADAAYEAFLLEVAKGDAHA